MQKKAGTVEWVMVGGVTLQAFVLPVIETANAHPIKPSKLAEVGIQRHLEGFLPDGPESQSRPVQTVRGIEQLVSSTSTEDIDQTFGTYQGIRWWLP